MDKFVRMPEVRVDGIKKYVYLTPVLAEFGDGYRIHHIDADGIGFIKTRFVPIEHVSKKRRKTLDIELENQILRELCEMSAAELRINGNVTDAATENLFDAMRKLGIEVD